jgi:type VI secretion system Hcp family effector
MKSSKLAGAITIAVTLCVLAAAGLVYASSSDFYLTFKGPKSGMNKGEATGKMVGSIPGAQFHYGVSGPREASTGKATGREANPGTPPKTAGAATSAPTGGQASARESSTPSVSEKRMHGTITIVKEVGPASPQLAQAMATGEVLDWVDFQFVRAGAGGTEEVYKTLHLTNVMVSSITKVGMSSSGDRPMESITFTFDTENAVAMSKDGKKMAMDDWMISK